MSAAADSLQEVVTSPGQPLRVAYVMSRFPKLTETFVLFEMLSMLEQGAEVEVFPLLRARNSATHAEAGGLLTKLRELLRRPDTAAVVHPEVARLGGRVHHRPLLSTRVVLENLRTALTRPGRYFGALAAMVRATLGSANYLLGGLSIFPKVVATARELERRGVQHVHAHFANHPATAAFVIRRISGIPYSFTAHGADLQVDQHMLAEKVREAAFTVAISETNRRFLLEWAGSDCADRVEVIRCGVDREVFAGRTRAREGDPLRILCVGTLYEVKGQTYLLDACERLADAGVPFTCRLVGDGRDRQALELRAEALGIADAVAFLGSRARGEVAEEIRSADVLVVPSVPTREGRREGIPVVCMEGMAGQAVVVASGISGIPELVEDGVTGLLVPPRDPEQLAAALVRLHESPDLRRQLVRGALERVERECDVHSNASRLLERMHQVHR